MAAKALVEKMEALFPVFIRDLEVLVNVDRGTGHIPGITRVVEFWRSRLKELGFQNEIISDPHYGPALVARRKGKGTARILLLAHADTVFPVGTAAERPFRVEGDKAYGPGVNDCGSGMTAGYYALKLLIDSGFDQYGELIYCLNPDEESCSPFSRAIMRRLARESDVALILEGPTFPDSFITARGGLMPYTIEVTGVPSHAGVAPEKGANAITELIYKLQELQALERHAGIYPNIATISGGERSNIVADYARAEIDFRVDHAKAVEIVQAAIERIANETTIAGTKTVVSAGPDHPPFEKAPGSDSFAELVKACGAEVGLSLFEEFCGGTTDGSFTAVEGTVTIDGLQPWGTLYHTPDEYVDLTTVVPRVALIALLMQRIASDSTYWVRTGKIDGR